MTCSLPLSLCRRLRPLSYRETQTRAARRRAAPVGRWSGAVHALKRGQVALRFPLADVDAVLLPLGTLGALVSAVDVLAERLTHDLVCRHLVEGFLQRAGQHVDATRLALFLRPVEHVVAHGVRRL